MKKHNGESRRLFHEAKSIQVIVTKLFLISPSLDWRCRAAVDADNEEDDNDNNKIMIMTIMTIIIIIFN